VALLLLLLPILVKGDRSYIFGSSYDRLEADSLICPHLAGYRQTNTMVMKEWGQLMGGVGWGMVED